MLVDMTKFNCSYCKGKILRNSDATMCPHCHVVMHKSCWEANKGCTTPGCKGRFNSGAVAKTEAEKPSAPQPVDPRDIDPYFGLDRKQTEKAKAVLRKYGLDSLTNGRDIASAARIAAELAGTGLMDAGVTLSLLGGDRSVSAADKVQVNYQRAIVEQNFILIRQLSQLNEALNKLLKDKE